MGNRQQLLLIVGICLAVFVALFALRRQIDTRNSGTGTRQEYGESDYDEGAARARASAARVTRFVDNDLIPTPHAATRIKRLSEGVRGEGFDAEKLRAFGDSSVFGTVRGPDGKPLAGVTVQLFENDPMTKNPPLREAVTDTTGTYSLDKLNDKEMRYILAVRSETFAPEARFVALREAPLEVNFSLEAGVEAAGVVLDAQTSLPLPRATVYFPCRGDTVFGLLGSVQAGPMGQFAFRNAPRGGVKTLAQHEGYHRTVSRLRTPVNDHKILMVPGGATLRGVTVSRLTRKPEGGAKVIAETAGLRESVMTSDEGEFEFTDMPAGKYRLVAVKGMPSDVEVLQIAEREVRDNIQLVLPAPLFVSGRVLHAFSSKPMPGVRIHFASPSGRGSVLSDDNGLFAFETLVVENYTIEVHEKGYLPLFEKRTTGSVERITRKISRSASSDQVTIRLRPVPAIEGIVRRSNQSGKPAGPVPGIDVPVMYQQRDVLERIVTRTDPLGKFFVNLPSGRRGSAKIIVGRRDTIAVEDVRIPTRKPVELVLKQTRMNANLYLTDQSPLSGVRIASNYFFPEGMAPDKAMRVPGPDTHAGGSGRFVLPLAEKQKVELAFYLPDGNEVAKVFDSDSLLRRRRTFIYDPVARDILHDVRGNDPPRQPQRGRQPQGQR